MSVNMLMQRDLSGLNTFGVPNCTNLYSATIAGAATTLTVPSTVPIGGSNTNSNGRAKWLAIFYYEPGTRVWVSINNTATVPAGATFVATNSFLNPVALEVQGKQESLAADVLSFVTADTSADVGVAFYAL